MVLYFNDGYFYTLDKEGSLGGPMTSCPRWPKIVYSLSSICHAAQVYSHPWDPATQERGTCVFYPGSLLKWETAQGECFFFSLGTRGDWVGQVSKSQPEKLHFAIQTLSRGNFTIPFPAAWDSQGGVRPSLQDGGVRPSLQDFPAAYCVLRVGRTLQLAGSFFPMFLAALEPFGQKLFVQVLFCPCPPLTVACGSSGNVEAAIFYLIFFPSVFFYFVSFFIGERRLVKTKGK